MKSVPAKRGQIQCDKDHRFAKFPGLLNFYIHKLASEQWCLENCCICHITSESEYNVFPCLVSNNCA